jgi:hypothetical protein
MLQCLLIKLLAILAKKLVWLHLERLNLKLTDLPQSIGSQLSLVCAMNPMASRLTVPASSVALASLNTANLQSQSFIH